MRQFILLLTSLVPLTAQYYVVSTVAGNGQQRVQLGSGTPTSVSLVSPRTVATDSSGNIFFADTYFNQVFRLSSTGQLSLYAGNGTQGSSGDGGPATEARLDGPAGLTVDTAGNLYIADANNSRIRRVTPAGVISTFLVITGPAYLAFNAAGDLFVSQPSLNIISRLPAGATVAAPFAGTGIVGFSGDGGPALSARLAGPQGIRFDAAGNLFLADTNNQRIRRITPAGVISTVAGDGVPRFAGDDGPALSASLAAPNDIAFDSDGVLYISDTSNGLIRTVNAQGRITRFAGGGTSFSDGPLLTSQIAGMFSIAFDSRNNLVVAAASARQIRRLASGVVTTIVGALPSANAGENVPATSTTILDPFAIAFDAAGNLHYSDLIDNRVRRISPAGLVTTTAGTGIFGNTGNDVPATNALVGNPRGLAFDRTGNLFIVSGTGATVRRVAASTNLISSVVGGRGAGFSGDGGPATQAQLFNPLGIATDAAGNYFIADSNNHRIRRVDATTQVISTFAGTGEPGFSGDGGPAIQAQINSPRFLAFDPAGNLLFTDTTNRRVRRISTTGIISTIAGTGEAGSTGDGGPAISANIGFINGIAVDSASNIYIASNANRIRRITPAGIISTIAGTGVAGFSGESSLATNATIDNPQGLAIDASGAIHFVDQRNFRIRKLTPSPIVAEGITNGATLRVGPVAPGEIISIFGFDLGPTPAVGLQLDASGKVANSLGGTQVLFDGIPAPLLFVSSGQINTVVPYAVAGKSTTRVQVQINGRITGTTNLPVTTASPGLFAITNVNGSVNTASNPAAQGSVLILYGTGEGQTIPEGIDGNVATAVFPKPIQEMTVTIGGRPATVLYAGAAPGFVSGVFQLNVTIPAGLTGTLPLQVKVGDTTTPAGINITVR